MIVIQAIKHEESHLCQHYIFATSDLLVFWPFYEFWLTLLLTHSKAVFSCQSQLILKGLYVLIANRNQQKKAEIFGNLFQEVLTYNSSLEAVCIVDTLVFAIMKARYWVTWYHITIIFTV